MRAALDSSKWESSFPSPLCVHRCFSSLFPLRLYSGTMTWPLIIFSEFLPPSDPPSVGPEGDFCFLTIFFSNGFVLAPYPSIAGISTETRFVGTISSPVSDFRSRCLSTIRGEMLLRSSLTRFYFFGSPSTSDDGNTCSELPTVETSRAFPCSLESFVCRYPFCRTSEGGLLRKKGEPGDGVFRPPPPTSAPFWFSPTPSAPSLFVGAWCRRI